MCEVPQLTDLDLTGIDTVAIDLETYQMLCNRKRKDGFPNCHDSKTYPGKKITFEGVI